MNNWLKRNTITTWKWYHWLVFYFLFFASQLLISFLENRVFGHSLSVAGPSLGVAICVACLALRVEWVRRTGRKRR